MKHIFTTVRCLALAMLFGKQTIAQEQIRPRTKIYPQLEATGYYNTNKTDILQSNRKELIDTRNSGGFGLGLGFTLFKPKQSGIMFSLNAGYKMNQENIAIKTGINEPEITKKATISALYLRPELSVFFKVNTQRFVHFGFYAEPNWVTTQNMPNYQLYYNKSNISGYNHLNASTYNHWGKNRESSISPQLPINLVGFSVGLTQLNSRAFLGIVKCRVFFEMDPRSGNTISGSRQNNRSYAVINYYEDMGTDRNIIATNRYLDKMMRLGLSVAVGL